MGVEAEEMRDWRQRLRRRWGKGGGVGVGRVESGGGSAGEGSGGTRVCTHSATSVTEEVCVAPPSEVYCRVVTQQVWSWGPVGSRLSSPGVKQWGGPTA